MTNLAKCNFAGCKNYTLSHEFTKFGIYCYKHSSSTRTPKERIVPATVSPGGTLFPRKIVVEQVKDKTETCNVCYSEEIPLKQCLDCGHAVCPDCLPNLRKQECPICKKPLKGPLVTYTVIQSIKNKIEDDKLRAELVAQYNAARVAAGIDINEVYGEISPTTEARIATIVDIYSRLRR